MAIPLPKSFVLTSSWRVSVCSLPSKISIHTYVRSVRVPSLPAQQIEHGVHEQHLESVSGAPSRDGVVILPQVRAGLVFMGFYPVRNFFQECAEDCPEKDNPTSGTTCLEQVCRKYSTCCAPV